MAIFNKGEKIMAIFNCNGVRQDRLNIRFYNEEDAIYEGRTFEDILHDDIFEILEEANAPVTESDMTKALRNGRMSNYSSQYYKNHCWTIPKGFYINEIAAELGYIIERPKHRKTGKPLKVGWSITV